MKKLSKLMKVMLVFMMILGNFSVYLNASETTEDVLEDDQGLYFSKELNNYIRFTEPFERIPKTLLMRFKIDANASERRILFGNYVWQKNCYALEITAANQLRYVEFVYENGVMITSVDVSIDSSAILNGEWVDFALVRDVDEDIIYFIVNGETVESIQLTQTGTDQLLSDVPLDTVHYIGNDSRNQYNLTGTISELQLWDKVISAQETVNYLHEEADVTDADLMHAYHLNEYCIDPVVNVVADQKTNGINGIAYGFDLPDAPEYEKQGTDFSLDDKDLEMKAVLDGIPMTVESWIRVSSERRGTRNIITGNYFDAYMKEIPLFNFELTINGEPRIFWYVNGVMTEYIAEGINLYNDRWTHVAISCEKVNESNVRFTTYINGNRVHSGSREFTPVMLNQPMKIGEDSRFAHYFKGEMADLRMWSTTRSAEEIAANFNTTVAADEAGLLGNWLLDQSDEHGVYEDRSVHGNDAMPYWIEDDLFAKAEDGYETIAVIPDTQSLAAWTPGSFTTLTTWLKDHADELGIKLAVHVGDIVNERSYASEWNAAKASMQVLDGVIPYVFSPGNHDTQIQQVDGVWYGVRDTSGMNNAFPYAEYAQAETFGGAYEEGQMDNTYSYFTVAGQQIMTISLEENPRDEVLAWANQVAAANPDRKIIVTTHEYLFYDGTRLTSDSEYSLPFIGSFNCGQQLWEKFGSKHENIIAIISGHVGYPDIVVNEAVGESGNVVKQILCDAQFMDRDDINDGSGNGLGMVMLLSFKEGSNDMQVRWYSTVREQFFRMTDQFESDMALFNQDIDKQQLTEAIRNANKLVDDEDEYTVSSWNALLDALTAAENIAADDNASQEQVDDAANALNSAISALQAKASDAAMAALQNIVDKANVMQEGSLNDLIANAQALLDDPDNASVNALVSAMLDLSEAMAELNESTGTDALRQDLEATIDFINENILTNVDNIRPAKVQALRNAIMAAQVVLDDEEATEDQLKQANRALTKAAQELWEIVTKAELEALIEAANGYLDGDYTAESIAVLQDAITSAQAVADNDDATTAEVTDAITDLANAIAGLESVTLDTSALAHEIDLVSQMIANLDDYVPSTVEGFADKLADAQSVLASATSQEEIDAATKTLREARLNARTKADVSALEELIAYVNSLDLSAYTSASVAAMNVPYAKALVMIKNEEVTQEQVDELAEEMQAAIDALEPVNANVTTPDAGNVDSSNNSTTAGSTNTAATTQTGMMLVLLAAAGAAVFTYRRKRS